MKLLVDMNLSPEWLAVLSRAGLEAKHWSTIGAFNAEDGVLMPSLLWKQAPCW